MVINEMQVKTLLEAIPYLSEFKGETVVV